MIQFPCKNALGIDMGYGRQGDHLIFSFFGLGMLSPAGVYVHSLAFDRSYTDAQHTGVRFDFAFIWQPGAHRVEASFSYSINFLLAMMFASLSDDIRKVKSRNRPNSITPNANVLWLETQNSLMSGSPRLSEIDAFPMYLAFLKAPSPRYRMERPIALAGISGYCIGIKCKTQSPGKLLS